MKVRELMTAEAKACSLSDTLNRAAQLMWENDCGAIPVVDEELRVIGMVTDRDICMAAYTQGVPLKQSRVASAMSKGAYTCLLGDDIAAAEKLMRECQVRRIPVVDDEGRLAGIISLSDVARQADRERVSKTRRRQVKDTQIVELLGAVSAPNGNSAAHAA
jgi:CBS domain-containing protein